MSDLLYTLSSLAIRNITIRRRTYKEIVEQLNGKGIAGEVIAVRKLPSSNIVLAIENEQARTS